MLLTLPDCVAAEIPTTGPVLVACSGGGDSVALLHLAVEALGAEYVHCATVDHHLREVSGELDLVRRAARSLGVPHHVLDWHWDGQGNLQARARDARRALLADHARTLGCKMVLLGHTADDQAETVLMRIARGSGVDGLAAMAARDGIWVRPLLGVARAELRQWLSARDIPWAEDPSNDETRFDRVKLRRAMPGLAEVGLTTDRLVALADMMRAERDVLDHALRDWCRSHVTQDRGDLVVDPQGFWTAPTALRSRFLGRVVQWMSGTGYKPRRTSVEAWVQRIATEGVSPLGGVLALSGSDLRFTREAQAVADGKAISSVPVVWDQRWSLSTEHLAHGLHVAPLGDALKACTNWRETGMPRQSLLASPAVWDGDALVAAPLAGLPNGWHAEATEFTAFCDSR